LIRLYEKCGQNAAEFCRENDLSPSSLWRWLVRARRDDRNDASAGGLVEIPMLSLRTPRR
jgi:transposase-like protein